jgi:hypothetical protein
MNSESLVLIVNLGLRMLSMRALVILALLLDCGLFSWAMYSGGWDRLAIAAGFGIVAWCTVHLNRNES